MDSRLELELKIKSEYLGDVWQNFCQLHSLLYELTCEEYVQLLASDIDLLDETLIKKQEVIAEINSLESQRAETINDINQLLGTNVTKIAGFTELLRENGLSNVSTRIDKLNLILLDVIEKLQDQNKKNQIYLNKALLSLQELKDSFSGGKKYKTYGANGNTYSSTR
jgi:flagellar biosynthesis/type III secretory pathway chaperone